tara:strand:- start:11 stop:352 length:342 start_codon:yes stop_codon:yes gene_type:complete
MTKTVYINSRAFQNIKNREKTIEGRIKRGLFNDVFVGEIIDFICNKTKSKCSAKISKINTYNSVFEFLRNEIICQIIPNCNKYSDAVNVYKKHYGEKLENKNFKFIGIHLILI